MPRWSFKFFLLVGLALRVLLLSGECADSGLEAFRAAQSLEAFKVHIICAFAFVAPILSDFPFLQRVQSILHRSWLVIFSFYSSDSATHRAGSAGGGEVDKGSGVGQHSIV